MSAPTGDQDLTVRGYAELAADMAKSSTREASRRECTHRSDLLREAKDAAELASALLDLDQRIAEADFTEPATGGGR